MEMIKAFILGVVEGITEWLPISSTGHMILVDEFLQMNVSPEFMSMFLVVIQLGAIFAVVFLYFNKLNPFSLKKTEIEKRDTWQIWFKVVLACIPAGVIGILFDDIIEEALGSYVVVALMLILYGVLFIIVEKRNEGTAPRVNSFIDFTYRDAIIIGLLQVLSLIPGTSRSGVTIVGGILFGMSRYIAAEFTFFLSIPVMLGASFLKLLKFGFEFTSQEIGILIVGCTTAFIVSIIAIKFLMSYIKKNDFKVFGYYRIILGILVLLYFGIIS